MNDGDVQFQEGDIVEYHGDLIVFQRQRTGGILAVWTTGEYKGQVTNTDNLYRKASNSDWNAAKPIGNLFDILRKHKERM